MTAIICRERGISLVPIHSFNRRFNEGRWDYTVKHQMSNEKNDTNPDRLQNFLITQAGPDAGKGGGLGNGATAMGV